MRKLGLLTIALCCGSASGQILGKTVHEGLTSDDPETVLNSVAVYQRFAHRLEPEDLRALSRSLRHGQTVRVAAPELQRTLETLAETHDRPGVRKRAATRAPKFDTYVRQVRLRREIERMHGEGVTGVALWSAAAKHAVELNLERGLDSNAAVWDASILDLGVAFNGSSMHVHLTTYRNTFGRLPGSDPLLDEALPELNLRPAVVGYAGSGLDHADEASDFRAELHDGTTNQIHHSSFFVHLGYLVGLHDPSAPHSVNLKHETLDPGSSVADWRASAVGIEIGKALRVLREQNADPRYLPTILGAAFSETPSDYAHPGDADLSSLVTIVAEGCEEIADSPGGQGVVGKTRSVLQEGLIRGLNWASGNGPR